MIGLDELTRREALRYLGIFESSDSFGDNGCLEEYGLADAAACGNREGSRACEEASYGDGKVAGFESAAELSKRKILEMMAACEQELSAASIPKYVYKKFKIEDCPLPLLDGTLGQDIKKHLEGCEYVALQAVTLGQEVDRLIRKAEITDMAKAVVMDALASAASEQVCREADLLLHRNSPGLFMTWRFSPGYGDFPISVQRMLLSLLDAGKRIGLAVSDSSILTPRKSVTGVIGLSASKLAADRLSDIYFMPAADKTGPTAGQTRPVTIDSQTVCEQVACDRAGHKCSRCNMAATCRYRRGAVSN